MAILSSLAAGAGIAAAGVTIASGISSMMGGQDQPSSQVKIPTELEANILEQFSRYLSQADQQIRDGFALIPKLEERVNYMNQIARAGTPDPALVQKLTSLDAEIAQRFGRETAADVKAGIITDRAKQQTIDLQRQLQAELESQGKQVDDKLAFDIQQIIRNRIASGSTENLALDEVGKALLEEVRSGGNIELRKDPRVERELQGQEDALRMRLRQQFGPDYENTTQGRRALRDFYQGATETRFSTATAASAARVQRLSELGKTASGLVESRDTGLLRNVEAVKGTQDILSGRIKRLSDINAVTQGTLQNVALAQAPEIERAKLALAASQNVYNQFNQGIANQGNVLQLSQIPFQMRQSLLQNSADRIAAGINIGKNIKISKPTQEAFEAGKVSGFKGRGQIYGGQFSKANQDRL